MKTMVKRDWDLKIKNIEDIVLYVESNSRFNRLDDMSYNYYNLLLNEVDKEEDADSNTLQFYYNSFKSFLIRHSRHCGYEGVQYVTVDHVRTMFSLLDSLLIILWT